MSIKQKSKSLAARGSQLSNTFFQLTVLNGVHKGTATFPHFSDKIKLAGFQEGAISPTRIEILQINVGKLCNQTCAHCHVDAGPDRKTENMSRAHFEKCLDILSRHDIHKVDITGGAPEMNPNFRWFVESCVQLGKHVMNRCNLTILRSNPKFADLPEFFASNRVEIISSLPHYSALRTDAQRGEGVFDDSIAAIKMLNEVGYGIQGTGLNLNLVYNPTGAFLPGNQETLEGEFKRQLSRKYGISFNNLYTITNMPISRFLEYLLESGNYNQYMETLVEAFNPAAVAGVMCRNTLSVGWDGSLYDCDFNQMLDLKVASPSNHLDSFDLDSLSVRHIALGQHCYGCTAGAGSSCGGTVA